MLASISDLPLLLWFTTKNGTGLSYIGFLVRKHVLTVGQGCFVHKSSDNTVLVIGKKYVNTKRSRHYKAFKQPAVCTGNNFGVKPKEILPCRFGLTFSDLTISLKQA